MNFEQALLAARERPNDEPALSALARAAFAEGREEAALPLLRAAAERGRLGRLWQWTGLLERALDEHERALESFKRAAVLAPTDRSIAHGRARVALEAGVPSKELFEAALQLSPGDPDVLLGYAASLLAAGRGSTAEGALDYALERAPHWIEGHVQLAQLRATMGKKELSTVSLERAIELQPMRTELWVALFRLLVQSQRFSKLSETVARARTHIRNEPELLRFEAIAAAESGQVDRADRLFAAIAPKLRQSSAVFYIRHLLRNGRLKEACLAIDAALNTEVASDIWPYASIAWRLCRDPRWHWLEGDLDRLVSIVDLSDALVPIPRLEEVLRKLHSGKGEFLDQSVRGGSQTDGPLFTRIEPEIRALRAAIVSAVEGYLKDLPAPDLAHPLLGRRRDRAVRFSGSWSVYLQRNGYHANHVHPEGWISSALYIHLPGRTEGESQTAGWLTLGEPDTQLGLDLPPFRDIEPQVGRLVLFPSYMWHGTRPFGSGERLTVAFDVRQPF